ncbi:MAG: leucyl aminopeptidase [Planctomycetes bacterium]|nr:leucyl aminopeptidase [Planctomycetota bacterium]NUQ35111.1 leucyl aminopeptidase [Planctomycetaceae bacterium]
MRANFSTADAATVPVEVMIVPAFEGKNPLSGYSYGNALGKRLLDGQFTGASGKTAFIGNAGALKAQAVILVGVGKKSDFTLKALRNAIAIALQDGTVSELKYAKAGIDLTMLLDELDGTKPARIPGGNGKLKAPMARWIGQATAEGASLGTYTFYKHFNKKVEKKKSRPSSLTVITDKRNARETQKGYELGEAECSAVNFVRDLVNEPGGTLRPGHFARAVQAEARKTKGLTCKILDKPKLEALKMGSFLSVNAGSSGGDGAARLIVLEYFGGGKREKPLVFVGKGLTFDSGGYDIKGADGMLGMKMDMGGGAAALGGVLAIARMKLPINVVALVGATENLINEHATLPGDVVKSMSGITIEIRNTDAEGRLVLADVLTYAQRTYEPDTVIDMATLTGAVLIALGDQFFAVMSNDDKIAAEILGAAKDAGELAWQLPLPKEYDSYLDSTIADVSNITGGRWAGTITAGLFLQRFVESGQKWAHLDIAGVAMNDSGHMNGVISDRGASGMPVRTLVSIARERAGV